MKRRIAWILAAVMVLAALPCLVLAEDAEPENSIVVFPEEITGFPGELSDPGLQKLIEDGTCKLNDFDGYAQAEITYPDSYIVCAYYDTATGQLIGDYGFSAWKELPGSIYAGAFYYGEQGLSAYNLSRVYEQDGVKVTMMDYYSPEGWWSCDRRIESEDGGFDLYLFDSDKNVSGVKLENVFDGAELKVKGGEWNRFTADADGKPVKNPDLDPEYAQPLPGEVITFGTLDVSNYPEYPVPETGDASLAG